MASDRSTRRVTKPCTAHKARTQGARSNRPSSWPLLDIIFNTGSFQTASKGHGTKHGSVQPLNQQPDLANLDESAPPMERGDGRLMSEAFEKQRPRPVEEMHSIWEADSGMQSKGLTDEQEGVLQTLYAHRLGEVGQTGVVPRGTTSGSGMPLNSHDSVDMLNSVSEPSESMGSTLGGNDSLLTGNAVSYTTWPYIPAAHLAFARMVAEHRGGLLLVNQPVLWMSTMRVCAVLAGQY